MSASNLYESQMRMARYLRDPDNQPAPEHVEERRLKIYRDLIYNNVEGFIRGGFPVLHSLYEEQDWHQLVRAFVDGHRCHSPYFLEISQEFIQFLLQEHTSRPCDLPFVAELAHYEWAELALNVSEAELRPPREVANVADARLSLSPLAWVLAYQYPVHRIGPGFQPQAPEQPVYLVVYRDRADEVRFMEVNAATARLLELLRDSGDSTVDTVLVQLAAELGMAGDALRDFAAPQLHSMLDAGVLEVQP